MQNLESFISKQIIEDKIKNTDLICIESDNELYSNLLEYYSNNIPVSIANRFDDIIFSTIIEENLMSHDYKKLEEKLYSKFSNNITGFETYTGKGNKQSFIIAVNNLSLKDDNDFIKTLQFYNYYIRTIDKLNKHIIIAPIYSENVTDYVWDECKGKGYVFIDNKDTNKILKTGLRCKTNVDIYNTSSDKVSNRCYMFATKLSVNKIDEKYLKSFVKKIARYKQLKLSDIGCIEVNLNKIENGKSIQWFKDNLMKDDEAVFTEQPISVKCLKEVKLSFNINEAKGDNIDEQWLNDNKPVMTKDGRVVAITKIDYGQVPNIIYGKVVMDEDVFDYEWNDEGMCSKATDREGRPKKIHPESDDLVKAC